MLDAISQAIGSGALSVGQVLLIVLPFLPETLATNPATIMLFVGFSGQGLFATRFIVQWVRSEQESRSIIPVAFWYFSIGGGVVLLFYALWRKDPVIICGQGIGLLIYARNLYFILRPKPRADSTPAE